jgi:hypothetical protein
MSGKLIFDHDHRRGIARLNSYLLARSPGVSSSTLTLSNVALFDGLGRQSGIGFLPLSAATWISADG